MKVLKESKNGITIREGVDLDESFIEVSLNLINRAWLGDGERSLLRDKEIHKDLLVDKLEKQMIEHLRQIINKYDKEQNGKEIHEEVGRYNTCCKACGNIDQTKIYVDAVVENPKACIKCGSLDVFCYVV